MLLACLFLCLYDNNSIHCKNNDMEVQNSHQNSPSNIKQKKSTFLLFIVVFLLFFVLVIGYYFSYTRNISVKPMQLTQKDSDTTIHAKQNQDIHLTLHLDAILDYSLKSTDPSVIDDNAALITKGNSDFTTTLHAKNIGTTTVFVFGRPNCKPNTICPDFITRNFKITINVEK